MTDLERDISQHISFPDPPRRRWPWVLGGVLVLALGAPFVITQLTDDGVEAGSAPTASSTTDPSTSVNTGLPVDPAATATGTPGVPGVTDSVAPTTTSATSAGG